VLVFCILFIFVLARARLAFQLGLYRWWKIGV
jgi:hypothetical protein